MIEQILSSRVVDAVKALYDADVPVSMIQLQTTKKEFEGHLSLV